MKRSFDIALASASLVLLAPIMVVIAVAIRLTSPGPIFFKQRRYGLYGEELIVFKFRSTTVCLDDGTLRHAVSAKSGVTPFGRFLQRTSLDELPQLLNVLQGRMSLVGPRPSAIAHNKQYRKLVGGYKVRHKVLPGLTGLAQVNGLRGEMLTVEEMRDRVKHDIDYVRKRSLWLDIRILFRTVLVVCRDDMKQSRESRRK